MIIFIVKYNMLDRIVQICTDTGRIMFSLKKTNPKEVFVNFPQVFNRCTNYDLECPSGCDNPNDYFHAMQSFTEALCIMQSELDHIIRSNNPKHINVLLIYGTTTIHNRTYKIERQNNAISDLVFNIVRLTEGYFKDYEDPHC